MVNHSLGYTPTLTDWSAAANLCSGLTFGSIWSMGPFVCDGLETYFKPCSVTLHNKWERLVMAYDGVPNTSELSRYINNATAERFDSKARLEAWNNDEHSRPGLKWFVDVVDNELNVRLYTEPGLARMVAVDDARYGTPRRDLIRADYANDYGYYASRYISGATVDTPQYETLWKDNKFSAYIKAVAKAQTNAALNRLTSPKGKIGDKK